LVKIKFVSRNWNIAGQIKVFNQYALVKAPQWYAVKEGDASMFIKISWLGQTAIKDNNFFM
jgi:hypothetical protein